MSRSDRTVETGSATEETETESVVQRYGLTWNRLLFPRLRLNLGATFERQDSTRDPGGVDSFSSRLFPYGRLTARSENLFTLVGYERAIDKGGTGPFTRKEIRESYRAVVAWRSGDLPGVRLEWLRSNLFDPARAVNDVGIDQTSLRVDWKPTEKLSLDYRGLLRDTEQRIEGNETRATTHVANVGYWDRWRGGRVTFGGEYTLVNATTEARSGPGAEIVIPVLPFDGLFAVDDTPLEGGLASAPALVDRDRDTGAGIDIGVPLGGEDPRPRNVGLDFGAAVPINRLVVWVDRALTGDVSQSFFWTVYASDDNRIWRRVQDLPSVPFDTFQNFFTLDLSPLESRYLKVVVAPLSPAVPGADQFPVIQITEVEAAVRSVSQGETRRFERTSQQLSANLRARLLEEVPLTYELTVFGSKFEGSGATGNIDNALSIFHEFNEVWSGGARASRSDQKLSSGSTAVHSLSASLSAVPLPTLRHNLVLGGSTRTGVDDRDEASVTWNGTAAVYRGVDVNATARRSASSSDVQGSFLNTAYGAGVTLTPHPTTTVDLSFRSEETDPRAGANFPVSRETRSRDASLSWRPVPALFLAYSRSVLQPETGPERRLTSAYVAWVPPSRGALSFSVNYAEIYRSEIDGVESNLSSGARWNISPRVYVDVAYVKQEIENRTLGTNTTTSTLTATARVSF